MLQLLRPPLILADELKLSRSCGVVFVDCGPEASNHLLAGMEVNPAAIIDHHLGGSKTYRGAFCDVRPEVAACASLVVEYLRELAWEPSTDLATALLYALRTETRGWDAVFSRVDQRALSWLTDRADHTKVAEIENAPVPRRHFRDLLFAIQNTFVYEDAAVCFLPHIYGPEAVGETADLLIRCARIQRILCAGALGGDLFLSARTGPGGGDAVDLLGQTLKGVGQFGGHGHRAGGKVPDFRTAAHNTTNLENLVRTRWLAACRVKKRRGCRLVAKRDIISHL